MTGLIRKATLLVVLGLVASVSLAAAGIPVPANCSIPAYCDLGGTDIATISNGANLSIMDVATGGLPDPIVSFTGVIRDVSNYPVVNMVVACSFNTDVRIGNAFPGYVSCQCVETLTDGSGVATFHVPGGGRNTTGGLSYTGANVVTWYAYNCGSTTVLATTHVATYDENGAATNPGVEVTDLSAWGVDFTKRLVPGRPLMRRSDFSHSGSIDVVDLSKWGQVKNSLKSKYNTFCI